MTVENGISVYPGLDNSIEENLSLIEQAHKCGLTRLFTSLHIPETDPGRLKKELHETLRAARDYGMEIISDISPATLKLLGLREFKASAFRMLGISTLRLDYGFGLEEIAHLSRHSHGTRLQLNASTMTGKLLSALIELKTDFNHIDALHNFYPRRGTGLSEETLVRKNLMLHKIGIRVGAFVPSSTGRKRGPLGDGLPTMEEHREEDTDLAARHLVALGTDSVFLSDSLPTPEEIASLGSLKGDQVTLSARLLTHDPLTRQLLQETFTARVDEARDAIRAEESRKRLKELAPDGVPRLEAENTSERPLGAVTLDNEGYGRYQGELQIIKEPQGRDDRVNVVAQVEAEEIGLLQYISPGRKFSFRFHD